MEAARYNKLMNTKENQTIYAVFGGAVLLLIIGLIIWNTASDNKMHVGPTKTEMSIPMLKYEDEETGLKMSYPAAWVKEGSGNDITFRIPYASPAPNSMSDLAVRVKVTGGVCVAPTDFATNSPMGKEMVGSLLFDHATSADAAMMHRYDVEYYATTQNGSCYTLTYSSTYITPDMNGNSEEASILSSNNVMIMNKAREDFSSLIHSFSFIDSPEGLNEADVPSYVLGSISPARASVGTKILLQGDGNNFPGHDTLVWIVKDGKSKGKEKAVIWGGMSGGEKSNEITFVVPAKACVSYTGASGLPCPWYMTMQPGDYQLYVQNQNGRSNSLPFTIF